MASFQDPNQSNGRDPDTRLRQQLIVGERTFRAQLTALTPPVADDRFVPPSPTRIALFNEMVAEIEASYAGDRLIALLAGQARQAATSLVSILHNFNGGNGQRCLDDFETLAGNVEEVESAGIGGQDRLDSYLDQNLMAELLPDIDGPRSMLLRGLIEARSRYGYIALQVLAAADNLHVRMTMIASALEGILTAIEAKPSRLEQESTREQAANNIKKFIEDLALPGISHRAVGQCLKGRYPFRLNLGSYECLVLMPGIDIDEVRPSNATLTESVARRYRLVVEDNSWLWEFGIGVARDALQGRRDD